MSRTDPRERYDDLVETTSHERVPPEAFAETAGSEVATVGWLVLGVVLDDADRVLLVDQPWADGWLAPGGVPEPGESLAGAVVREVREETDVEASVGRPHGRFDHAVENAATGETTEWTGVFFEATAETTTTDPDPGLDDETITEVRWFDDLPDRTFNPELTVPVYRRCLDGSASE